MIRRVLAILKREVWQVCLFTLFVLPVGMLMSFCLVGFPIMSHGLAGLVSTLVRSAHDEHGLPFRPTRPGWAGALALFGIAALLGTALVGSGAAGAVLGDDHPIAQTVAAVVAAAMAGAALAPFALAPFVAASGVSGLVQPLHRSVELAARFDTRRLAVLGATAGALSGGTFIGCLVLAVLSANAIVVIVIALALQAVLAFAFALLADTYVRASTAPARAAPARTTVADRPHLGRATPEPRPAGVRLRTLALVLVPLLVFPIVAAVVAAFTPTAMRPVVHTDERFSRTRHEDGAFIPGTRVRVRSSARGVIIEADDGGGAGAIRAFFPIEESEIFLESRDRAIAVENGTDYGGAPGTFAVLLTNSYQESAYAIIDRDGVRQDDGLEDRVLGRLGIVGGAALALGLFLLLMLAGRLGLSLGEARTLDAPDLRAAAKGARKALEGTLSFAGATLRRRRGTVHVEGEAWFTAGTLRIRLPERAVPALGDLEREPRDGQPVVLVSRFQRALTSNLREASAPWPDDGLLVLGTRADASDALVQRATRLALWSAVPAIACLVAAIGVLLSAV